MTEDSETCDEYKVPYSIERGRRICNCTDALFFHLSSFLRFFFVLFSFPVGLSAFSNLIF